MLHFYRSTCITFATPKTSLYRINWKITAKNMQSTPPPCLVVSGPSGAGKTTLIKKLLAEYPKEFGFSVSFTTRPPRASEVNGIDYHFTTKEKMSTEISEDNNYRLLYSGHLYGQSKEEIQRIMATGKSCVCCVEMQGVLSIKKLPELDAKARYIFVVPPNLEDLKQRLIDRGETTESVERRLKATQWEIETAEKNSTHEEIVQTNYLVELFDATIVTDIPEIAYQDFKKAVFEPFTKITS